MNRKLAAALTQQKNVTKQRVPRIYGALGLPIGGVKVVEVANRNSYVYVRLRNNQSEVIQAFNNQVAPAYNLPVIVERQGNRYTVVEVDSQRYENNWTSFAPFLPRHGNTHSFDTESGGGGDVVFVHAKQFMPSLVFPSGSLGGPNVLMAPYILKNDNGTWKYTGNTGTSSLLPYKPNNSSGTVLILVYLDSVSGNPSLLIGSGTFVPVGLTGTSQIVPYIPTVTNPSTQIPLSVVRLVSGTTQITWDNIYDVRQFIHGVPSGSGGSSSSSTGTAVAIWDEGIPQGTVTTLNFVGTNVDASVSGTVARIFVTGSTGGSAFTGLSGSVALLDANGLLTSQAGLKWGLNGGNVYLEYGANVVKEANAGRMGYQLFDSMFDIVGAGTAGGERWVKVYDNLSAGLLQGGNIQNVNLRSSWIYLDATGTMVGPLSAPELTIVTGSVQLLGLNAQNSFESVRVTVEEVSTYNLSPAYIDGLAINYLTSGSVSVSPGCAFIPNSSRNIFITGSLSASFSPSATNSSGTWQHVYMFDNVGVTAVEVSTTLPSVPYSGVARTKTGDNSRRYLGSVYCDAGGYLYKFTPTVIGNVLKMNWLAGTSSVFPFQVGTGLASNTATTLPITHLVPVQGAFSGLSAQIVVDLAASGDINASIGDSIPAEQANPSIVGEINTRLENAKAVGTMILFLPATEMKLTGRSIQYATLQNAGANTMRIRVKGVSIQR